MQFIIIAHDGNDDGALERRMKARDQHIALGDQMKQEGAALFGAAMLDELGKMNGSVYIVDFPSRTELDEWLKTEPYVLGDVWKDIEIIPCKVGPSFLQQS